MNEAPGKQHENRAAALIIALAAITAAVLLWTRRDYIAMWDGRIYAECVIDASQHLLSMGGYRCAGHISQSYIMLLALAQALAPASPVPMLAMNAILLAVGAWAMHCIARRTFPGKSHAVGRSLLVATFLLHPVILGTAVQPGLDFGMLIFSMCALAAAIEGWTLALVAFGVMLVFSKEPGALVYGVVLLIALWRGGLSRIVPNGAYWLTLVLLAGLGLLNVLGANFLSAAVFALLLMVLLMQRRRPAAVPAGEIWSSVRRQWTAFIPLVLLIGYMGVNVVRVMLTPPGAAGAAAPIVWSNAGAGTLIAALFRPGIIDIATLALLALVFIVGFLWIPTLLMLIDAFIGMVRRARKLPPRIVNGTDLAVLGMVTAAFIGELWFLSRYRTYNNARYYLPVYPLALIVAYGALARLGGSRLVKVIGFGAFALLLAISTVRTIDPISRRLWGTFPVGAHSMLVVTSITGECCGAGRDQLAYNMEFTRFGQLTSDLLSKAAPGDTTTVVIPMLGNWYTVGRLDKKTHRRTLARSGVTRPRVLLAAQEYNAAIHSPTAWYLELPYLDNSESLNRLNEVYDIGPAQLAERDGYVMAMRPLELRAVSTVAADSTKRSR